MSENFKLCGKCKKPDAIGFERKLIGGYHCLLCTSCVNDWLSYLNTTNELLRFHRANTDYEVAVSRGDDSAAHKALMAYLDAKQKLFDLGKEWYECTYN